MAGLLDAQIGKRESEHQKSKGTKQKLDRSDSVLRLPEGRRDVEDKNASAMLRVGISSTEVKPTSLGR